MKMYFLSLFLALPLLLTTSCAANNGGGDAQFHPPQTEAERALDRILQITDKDFTILKEVGEYLDNKNPKQFKHSRQFTEAYLQAWAKRQLEWLKNSCEGRDRNKDPYYDCDYLPVSCVRDAHYPYVYRTEKANHHEAVISYTWPESNGYAPASSDVYASYRMIRDNDEWKLDGADCGDSFNGQ